MRKGGVEMIYPNLEAEMKRYAVRRTDIARALGTSNAVVTNRLNGVQGEMSISDALTIRDLFFPGMDMAYLFRSRRGAEE